MKKSKQRKLFIVKVSEQVEAVHSGDWAHASQTKSVTPIRLSNPRT